MTDDHDSRHVRAGPSVEVVNGRLLLWSASSALAGFLFGFDTVVISGAEQTIQRLWNLSAGWHGLAVASALYGTVLGALFGGWPTDRFGRKTTLLLIGVLYCVAAIGSALATDVGVFTLARLIGGVGIGVSTIAAPLYIAEIAPAEHRGRLTGMFQFNIVLGILIAYLSNALLSGVGVYAWRWMLGVAALPSLLYTALCVALPESPRWLIVARGDRVAGLKVLRLIRPDASDAQITAEATAIGSAAGGGAIRSAFWTARLRRPILLAVAIAFFNQMSGINAILYFSPRIFALTGLAAKAATLQSVGIGVTNLVFTYAGLRLIDRLGRRTLLLIGSFGYIASLGTASLAFHTHHYDWVPPCIFAFIAAHAIGQGAVIWVYIAEIFPDRHRAEGQTLGSFVHWAFAALLTTFFPIMVVAFAPAEVFMFFTCMMLLQLLWVVTCVVETKQISLEHIQAGFGRSRDRNATDRPSR
jgi:sugar porter (SP) family MFS transporter